MGWSDNTTTAYSGTYSVGYENVFYGNGGSGSTYKTNTYETLLERICYLEHKVESLEKFVEDLKDFAASKDIEEYLGTILENPLKREG